MALTWHPAARRQDDEDEEEDEQTAWERVTGAAGAAVRKLGDWGVVSPRLMLAGGGLFLTLSNWGLLPSVRACICMLSCQTAAAAGLQLCLLTKPQRTLVQLAVHVAWHFIRGCMQSCCSSTPEHYLEQVTLP